MRDRPALKDHAAGEAWARTMHDRRTTAKAGRPAPRGVKAEAEELNGEPGNPSARIAWSAGNEARRRNRRDNPLRIVAKRHHRPQPAATPTTPGGEPLQTCFGSSPHRHRAGRVSTGRGHKEAQGGGCDLSDGSWGVAGELLRVQELRTERTHPRIREGRSGSPRVARIRAFVRASGRTPSASR